MGLESGNIFSHLALLVSGNTDSLVFICPGFERSFCLHPNRTEVRKILLRSLTVLKLLKT